MFTLIDGVERNAENPDTFEIPTLEERLAVQPGDYAKVGFECEDQDLGGERMWVQVERIEDGQWIGTLANDPMVIPSLRFGDEVRFEAKHIIGIY